MYGCVCKMHWNTNLSLCRVDAEQLQNGGGNHGNRSFTLLYGVMQAKKGWGFKRMVMLVIIMLHKLYKYPNYTCYTNILDWNTLNCHFYKLFRTTSGYLFIK